jgi:hypothetical protein
LHVRTERYYNSLEKYLNLSLLEYWAGRPNSRLCHLVFYITRYVHVSILAWKFTDQFVFFTLQLLYMVNVQCRQIFCYAVSHNLLKSLVQVSKRLVWKYSAAVMYAVH